jgi:hypothetical protein
LSSDFSPLSSRDNLYVVIMVHLVRDLTSPVTTWLEARLFRNPIPADGKLTFGVKVSNFCSQLCASFRCRRRRRIIQVSSRPSTLPTQLDEGILHWSHLVDPSTRKALWITTTRHQIDGCADSVFQLCSATGTVPVISVDVGQKKRIFWPLLHGLGTMWPEFNQQQQRLPGCD